MIRLGPMIGSHSQDLLQPTCDNEDHRHDQTHGVDVYVRDSHNPDTDQGGQYAQQDREGEPLAKECRFDGTNEWCQEQLGDLVEPHRIEEEATGACVDVSCMRTVSHGNTSTHGQHGPPQVGRANAEAPDA